MKTIQIEKNVELGGFDIILSYIQLPFNSNAIQKYHIKSLQRTLYLLKRNVKNGYEYIY